MITTQASSIGPPSSQSGAPSVQYPTYPHDSAGALREGAALLQGLALCGHCGRKLLVAYSGRNAVPTYYCPGQHRQRQG